MSPWLTSISHVSISHLYSYQKFNKHHVSISHLYFTSISHVSISHLYLTYLYLVLCMSNISVSCLYLKYLSNVSVSCLYFMSLSHVYFMSLSWIIWFHSVRSIVNSNVQHRLKLHENYFVRSSVLNINFRWINIPHTYIRTTKTTRQSVLASCLRGRWIKFSYQHIEIYYTI